MTSIIFQTQHMNPPSKPSRKEQSHERILEAASRALRRTGYEGVGVADVMKEAGLTHGGFYAHFESREALLVEALEFSGRSSARQLAGNISRRRGRGASPFRALVEAYLSDAHLNQCEQGCAVAALSSEMPRQAESLRAASVRRIEGLLQTVQQCLPASPAAQQDAPSIVSTLVGALQMARTLGANAQGRAWLASTRQALIDRYDTEVDANPGTSTH